MDEEPQISTYVPHVLQGQGTNRVPKRRNRSGCLTCRTRRKKCDGVRPQTCGHCRRLNLVCHWQRPHDIEAVGTPSEQHPLVQRQSSPNLPSISSFIVQRVPAPLRSIGNDAYGAGQRSEDRKLALRYYIQSFATLLTTNLENNGFLSVLLPMAIEAKPVLDMLIAWSLSHLSLCDETYRVKALENRSTALQSFTASLIGKQDSPKTSLACCLVFCSTSAILGDTAGWHDHLVGASNIIRHAGLSSSHEEGLKVLSDDYEGRWLLRNFAYHDILMSVTSDHVPLIPGLYWTSEPKTAIDSYFGLASEPMALISKISSMNGDAVPYETSYAFQNHDTASPLSSHSGIGGSESPQLDKFTSCAYEIELELLNWICPESSDPSLFNLAEAYRSAALIYLYRVIRRRTPAAHPDVDDKIQIQVTAIIHHLGQMPLRCLPECTSLFPLFMAGGETRNKPAMQFIRERMQHIATYRHFENASSALSVLEELWLQHTSITGLVTNVPLDWLDILKRRDWCLALS